MAASCAPVVTPPPLAARSTMSQGNDAEKAYEKLRREHEKLDKQVADMEGKRWLSASEESEVKQLKKLKLAKKDQMRQLSPEA